MPHTDDLMVEESEVRLELNTVDEALVRLTKILSTPSQARRWGGDAVALQVWVNEIRAGLEEGRKLMLADALAKLLAPTTIGGFGVPQDVVVEFLRYLFPPENPQSEDIITGTLKVARRKIIEREIPDLPLV